MKRRPLTFCQVVGNVAQLASAVSAVMAAARPGGPSLLLLAPNIVSLTDTVYNNGSELVKAVLDDKQTEARTEVKDKYDAVKSNVEDVTKVSQKITNMVDVIDNIRRAKTSDNSKLIDLVQKWAQLAYEHLLKQQELQMA